MAETQIKLNADDIVKAIRAYTSTPNAAVQLVANIDAAGKLDIGAIVSDISESAPAPTGDGVTGMLNVPARS